MNLNELLINRDKTRGRRNIRAKNAVYGVNKVGVPPQNLPSRKCSTSSDLNWGKTHINVTNTTNSARKNASSSRISSDKGESKIIVALTEGRGDAKCEVGLAAISVSKPLLILCQISDTQSYINTLTKINIFNAHEIILPSTFTDNVSSNRLIDILKKHFPNIKYTGVRRNLFNKINGLKMLSNLCIPSLNGILLILQHRYYALAAASALISHIQDALFIYYATGSIKIDYQESEGYTIIDISTADRLELVCSTKPAQGNRYSSLFGILNHCQTKIGARTLRSTILRPPCKMKYIEERLKCVTALVNHPESLISIQNLLQKIANIDLLLSIGTIIPSDPQKCCSRQLSYILLLNSLIDLINPLKDVVAKFEQPFFVQMSKTLDDKGFENIKTIIKEIISENAYSAKGKAGIMERCFAIKPGINGLLDLVRKTYSERINGMREYVKSLAEKYNLALKLGNNQTKGHHLILPLGKQKRNMKNSDLPEEFIQVKRLARSFTMKTPELVNLSVRLEDIMKDILSISNVMVHSLIIDVKKYTYLFYILCEEIAHLDVLQSLAETSVIYGYIRPNFGAFTEITFARNPLLDFLLPTKPISNPVNCSDDFNVHIITGPNGSGKSIFIRQVLLLQVMAQVGCYIPAMSAIMKPVDFMFARIYLEDNMEYGASSFVLEMKEIKYAMTTMTDNSLIIIDELCRSTSVEEGTALAIAIIEKMAESSAYIYITTHYILLTQLYNMYPNVKIWQMETTPIGEDHKTFKLDYKYNLIPGVTTVKHYGVYIVRNIWPDTIMKYVDEILSKISSGFVVPDMGYMDEKIRLKYSIEADFRKLKSQRQLTLSKIKQYLNKYQTELQKLGYLINIDHLHELGNYGNDFPPDIFEDDLPPLQHSVLGDVVDADRRMREIFTPSIHSQQSTEIDTQELIDMFTQESDQRSQLVDIHQNQCLNNSIQGCLAFSDSASYKNVSGFIAENSENINKLMPEVHIYENKENQQCFNDIDATQNENIYEHGFSLHLHNNRSRTSTPLVYPSYNFYSQEGTKYTIQINNVVGDIENTKSLKEDLEISCQLLDEDDPFEKETSELQDVSLESTSKLLHSKNNYLDYVSPIVNVITGPNNTTLSFGEEDNQNINIKEFKINIISNILLNNNNVGDDQKQDDIAENMTESQQSTEQICDNNADNDNDSFEPPVDTVISKDDFNLLDNECYENSNDNVEFNLSPIYTNIKDDIDENTRVELADDRNKSCTPTMNMNYNSDHTSNTYKIEVIDETKFGKSTETSKEKTSTITVSNASKLRQLDRTTTDSDDESSSKNVDNSMTSISSASNKRNLDQTTSESTPNKKKNYDPNLEQLYQSVRSSSSPKSVEPIHNLESQNMSAVAQQNKSTGCPDQIPNLAKENDKNNYHYKNNEDSITTSTKNISIKSTESEKHDDTQEDDNENSSSLKESDASGSTNERKFAISFIRQEKSKTDNSTQQDTRKSQRPAIRQSKIKFIPPRKLSAKEIRKEFAIQNKKLLEDSNKDSANMSKYLEQLINRPTIQQIQNTSHLALIRKTSEGLEIIPAEKPRKKKQKTLPPTINNANKDFNMSIFSDKNAKSFEQYLNSNEKVKTFNFLFQKQDTANIFEFPQSGDNVTFVKNKSEEMYKCSYSSQQSSYFYMRSQQSVADEKNDIPNLTPDGYYNKKKTIL